MHARKRLHKDLLFFTVFCHVVADFFNNAFFVSFYLSVGLRVVGCGCLMFAAEDLKYDCEQCT